MKRARILPVACLVAAVISPVLAQTYQWKDSQGKTIISDSPPPTAKQPARTIAPTESPASGAAPKSYAEKEAEFRKRQQESRESSEKAAKEAQAATERKENCERARRQLMVLESGQRMSTVDANGERRFIEDNERQREIERTRRFVADTCK